MKHFKKPVTCLAVLGLLMTLSCLPGTSIGKRAMILFTVGDVKVIDTASGSKPAESQQLLSPGDRLVTGADAVATIQVGDDIIIKLLEKSSLSFEEIFNKGENRLYLSEGTVLSKIKKLQKGSKYMIRTPSAYAAVRGTRFSVSATKKVSIVAVAEGKVEVKKTDGREQKDVEGGSTAVLTEEITLRDISKRETLVLDKLNVTIPRSMIRDRELKNMQKQDREKDKEIDRQLQASAFPSLAEIRQKYGRIDVVVLYTGKVYRGVITQRGNYFTMLTPQGTIRFPYAKVKESRTE